MSINSTKSFTFLTNVLKTLFKSQYDICCKTKHPFDVSVFCLYFLLYYKCDSFSRPLIRKFAYWRITRHIVFCTILLYSKQSGPSNFIHRAAHPPLSETSKLEMFGISAMQPSRIWEPPERNWKDTRTRLKNTLLSMFCSGKTHNRRTNCHLSSATRDFFHWQ